jgi:hypothetical protein
MKRANHNLLFTLLILLWSHYHLSFGQEHSAPIFHDFQFTENVLLSKQTPSNSTEIKKNEVAIYSIFQKSAASIQANANFTGKLNKSDISSIQVLQIHQSDTSFLAFRVANDSNIVFQTYALETSSVVQIWLHNKMISQLWIDVFPLRAEKVYIIPLYEVDIKEIPLFNQINQIFDPYHLQFEFQVMPSFESLELSENALLDNPSAQYDHYTRQMRKIRDGYFKQFPKSNREAYYIFLHEGFVNKQLRGYAVKNKNLSFVQLKNNSSLAEDIARELARSIGGLDPIVSSDEDSLAIENLMLGEGGLSFNEAQWRLLHQDYRAYQMFDNDEEINTNNGFIAYYFWEENEDGTIKFNLGAFRNSINRPYKKNYFSYILDIEKRLFKPLFFVTTYPIATVHILFLLLYLGLAFWLRNKWENTVTKRIEHALRIRKLFIRSILAISVLIFSLITFITVNNILTKYELFSGTISEFKGMDLKEVKQEIQYNKDIARSEIPEMASEIIIKRGENWVMKRRKKVLYFELEKDSIGQYSIARFATHSDTISLTTLKLQKPAESHYFVVSWLDEEGEYAKQQIFNHQGVNVTKLIDIDIDPAKRVLLFVNGYRPTSLGQNFEENFRDIRKNGIEYPDSRNMIYNFDRYEYWRPWRNIDAKFEKRINPSETYYADGHFSVKTSNYRSMVQFTDISTRYPKRCSNQNHHVCQDQGQKSWFKSADRQTHRLLPNNPNYEGFKKRMKNGEIAGQNLLQQLNEIPNSSSNDTLFIVAHSMGYAYALGMIKVLRSKINFGGFYIIAPENAGAGNLNASEWREIWQYGIDHEKYKSNAPCMLDGVAPQVLAKGLSQKQQIFMPEKLYRRFGFFDSHFIGYYDWILELGDGDKGGINQR